MCRRAACDMPSSHPSCPSAQLHLQTSRKKGHRPCVQLTLTYSSYIFTHCQDLQTKRHVTRLPLSSWLSGLACSGVAALDSKKLPVLLHYLSAYCGGRKQTDLAHFMCRDVIGNGLGIGLSGCQALSGVGLEHVPQEITRAWATSQSQQRRHQPHPARLRCSPLNASKRRGRRLTDTMKRRKASWSWLYLSACIY